MYVLALQSFGPLHSRSQLEALRPPPAEACSCLPFSGCCDMLAEAGSSCTGQACCAWRVARYDKCCKTHRDGERNHQASGIQAATGPDVPHESHAVDRLLFREVHGSLAWPAARCGAAVDSRAFRSSCGDGSSGRGLAALALAAEGLSPHQHRMHLMAAGVRPCCVDLSWQPSTLRCAPRTWWFGANSAAAATALLRLGQTFQSCSSKQRCINGRSPNEGAAN